MTTARSARHLVTFAVAFSMAMVPTVGSAATVASATPQTVSPLIALSYLASGPSRAALCGVAIANSATTAATTTGTTTGTTSAQGVPAQGCVLPVVDAVPVPVATTPVAGNGFSLLGPLAALLAGLVAVLVLSNLFDDDDEPVSPD